MSSVAAAAKTPARPWADLGLIALIAASTPAALWVESLVLRLMPTEFEELRAWLRPEATTAAWILTGFAVVTSLIALAVQRRLFLRMLSSQQRGDAAYRLRHARIQAIALGSSIPQVPALLATVAHMLGAELGAAAAAIGAATLGVGLQAFGLRRGGALDLIAASDSESSED